MLEFKDFIPGQWYYSNNVDSIWVSAFKVLKIVEKTAHIFQIKGLRNELNLEYLTISEIRWRKMSERDYDTRDRKHVARKIIVRIFSKYNEFLYD
jgi:hypothetical protein